MVNLSAADAFVIAGLGYGVVFSGIILLMLVMLVMSRIMTGRNAVKAETRASEEPAAVQTEAVKEAVPAPGSAGELKLYDTDPRDAAMIMAIVADTLGRPINELRFISIREVKE